MVKGKAVPVHTCHLQTIQVIPLISNLGTTVITGQLHIRTTLIPLPTKYEGAKWLHSRSGRSGDDKNLLFVMGFKPFIFQPAGKSKC